MSSPVLTGESVANPLAPLAELLGWLASTTFHITIGILLGMGAAHLMRRRHLRWTWAASALAPLLLARPVLGGLATTLDTAVLCAALRGRHWHQEDLVAGGDLAEIAASRRGPLTSLRLLSTALAQKLGSSPASGAMRGERMMVGRAHSGEMASIPFGAAGDVDCRSSDRGGACRGRN
jgi:hypothetical protein